MRRALRSQTVCTWIVQGARISSSMDRVVATGMVKPPVIHVIYVFGPMLNCGARSGLQVVVGPIRGAGTEGVVISAPEGRVLLAQRELLHWVR